MKLQLFRHLGQSLRHATETTATRVCRGSITHTRRYATPIVRGDVEDWQSRQTLEEKVQQIVDPGAHVRIQRSKEAAQAERLQRQRGAGAEVIQGRAHQRSGALKELSALYARVQKKQGKEITAGEYAAFLEGFCEVRGMQESVTVLRDMRAAGLRVAAVQYAMVLRTARAEFATRVVYEIEEEMEAAGVLEGENEQAVQNGLIAGLAATGQTEHAYAVYLEVRKRGMSIQRAGIQELVAGLASIDEVGLALEVLRAGTADGMAFAPETYAALLRAAGRRMHHEAYTASYTQLTEVAGARLTEGDCLGGLDVAARSGDVELATNILQRLQRHGYALREQHLEALLEALVRRGQWARAFAALAAMRRGGMGRGPSTLRMVTRTVAASANAEADADAAFDALVAAPTEAVDACVLDALVAGLALGGHVEAAEQRLSTWFTRLQVQRTAVSYVSVLRGCTHRRNKTVAERVLAQLLDDEALTAPREAYEQMVLVALLQPNYEDAFVYLEAMKAHSMLPSWRTYAALARRCARVRDPRAHVAVQEMRKLGYVVTPALLSFVDTHGRNARYMPQAKGDDADAGNSAGFSVDGAVDSAADSAADGAADTTAESDGLSDLRDLLGTNTFTV
ncbi:Telomerase protein component 1 [Coemansia sp. RSA 988]|nr:Telomerase protein component 1 [Coemansia sp. RSA 988]